MSDLDVIIQRLSMRGHRMTSTRRRVLDVLVSMPAHFTVEESSYFPLIELFSPPHAYAVRAARLAHREIRESLNDLHELTEASRLVEARRALSRLLDHFCRHEAEETKLIAKLETLAAASND